MYVKKNDQQWEHYGLTDISISSIAIENNLMYAATDSGLYVRDFVSNIEPEINNHNEIDYLLYPAYPNPFNPITRIKYSIPMFLHVTIKIYDILGREVAVLVNEEKSLGEYEVDFKASGLSSGIYFYQLKAGSFIETKKMILLR